MPEILPTYTCFDDVIEILTLWVQEQSPQRIVRTVRLCHGIARFPEDHPDPDQVGHRFAHAWLEKGTNCYTIGLLEGERLIVERDHDEFYERLRIARVTRYTVRQAWRQNQRYVTYGPWRPEYLALCRNEKGKREQ